MDCAENRAGNISAHPIGALFFDNISFEVMPGEIFGMIGPNGAGKTSIMECLEGLNKSCTGHIRVSGIDPGNRKELYDHIGVQLQEASFPDMMKVEELCRLFSSFYKIQPTIVFFWNVLGWTIRKSLISRDYPEEKGKRCRLLRL